MLCSRSLIQIFTLIFVSSTAQASRRSLHSSIRARKDWSVYTNASHADDYAELVKRDGNKYMFMHHIVGNTYPYVIDDWKHDIQMMQSKGIDAIALNIGSDSWQRVQVLNAYNAAQQLGTGFKMFISLDFTEMPCVLSDIIALINQYANHPSQFRFNGKVFISSFAGDCLRNDGWQILKSQTNGYLMPFIWGLENQFNSWTALDSWYCWGCAWPQGNHAKTADDDHYYIGQLGSRYATTVGGWMFTHYNYKNFYLRSDDWLIINRWEQIVAMRNQLTFVEMVTWNDFGESDYFGPIKGAQPHGTTWANNFPHTPWLDLSAYYITAFKTGVYPPITQDTIYFWARPHPASASASGDGLGKPSGWDWTQDTMWAAVFATAPATVILNCGSSSKSFNVGVGVSKLSIPLAPGKMTVKMIRAGQQIIDYTPDGYTFITNPIVYNYNAWVGSASASTPPTVSSTTTTSTTTTSSTTSTTTSPTGTPTGYNYVHCYRDDNARILSQSSSSSSTQTTDGCLAKCANGGYIYAGVEYNKECYCGNALRADAVQAPENECSMPCAGNPSQTCGGSWRINVYRALSTSPTTTTTSPTSTSTPSWSPYGCVAEGTIGSRRALTGASYRQSNMTPQVCQNLCSGYLYAGVEYGTECFCGNTLTNNGATGAVFSSSNCNVNCGGDASQKCGGSWTMNVYKRATGASPVWNSAGCYTDAITRILRGTHVRQNGMTTDTCLNMCTSSGYTMAATEDGQECFCGSQFYKENGAGAATTSNQCSTPCDGNSAQSCGGPWRANLYLAPGTNI